MPEDSDQNRQPCAYLPKGASIHLPRQFGGRAITVTGWFIWLDGDGPLVASSDGRNAFLFDCAGCCAYRIGDVEHVTDMPTSWLRGRWIFAAVAVEEQHATLWINGDAADEWHGAPMESEWSEIEIMRDAVGFAADFAVFERRLPDERLETYWQVGRSERL